MGVVKESSKMFTVTVIEDDPDFRDLLSEVFSTSNEFELKEVFSTIEQFASSIPEDHTDAQAYLSDLLVIDVMSSGNRIGDKSRIDGVTVATFLRQSGLQFAVLLVSSMKSHHFALHGSRNNWQFLPKSSRLTSQTILQSAHLALELD
jgi:CheY-like chemotaxis protein